MAQPSPPSLPCISANSQRSDTQAMSPGSGLQGLSNKPLTRGNGPENVELCDGLLQDQASSTFWGQFWSVSRD